MPDNTGAVRGNINSVIFLESVVGGTRVRYVCEVEPKGWLPTVVRRAACVALGQWCGLGRLGMDWVGWAQVFNASNHPTVTHAIHI